MSLRTLLFGLFSLSFLSLHAQQDERTMQDSLRLRQLLDADGEPELNRDRLPRLEMDVLQASPDASAEKGWMEFDTSLPIPFPKKRSIMTLRPYTPNTPYNWDPVREKKIEVKPDTWRSNPFYELTTRTNYTNRPAHAVARPSGHDFMLIFTREFWDVKGRKRRARTMEVLRSYGDSITIQERRYR